jgi:hypothetical protein
VKAVMNIDLDEECIPGAMARGPTRPRQREYWGQHQKALDRHLSGWRTSFECLPVRKVWHRRQNECQI